MPRPCRRSATGLVLLLAGLALPALASDSFLSPLGPVAEAQRAHLLRVVGITMIAIVPVLLGVPLILWRYRRRGGGTYRPDWDRAPLLEAAMWGVPVAIICFLGGWLWHATQRLDPYAALGPDPLVVQAIGLDWKWLFVFPEQGVASVGEIAVPVGRPVTIQLTTDTVMQSFHVAALAGQIYAMPGMATQLNFRADRAGTAEGENTQYNGDGFAQQKFALHALSPDDWEAWIAGARGSTLALDDRTYAALARRGTLAEARTALAPGQSGGPLFFGSVPADLLHRVQRRYHDGRPLAPEDQPGAPGFTGTGGDG